METLSSKYKSVLDNQRAFFRSGKTKSIEFRIQQLTQLKKVILEHESELLEALKKDLNKPSFEAYMSEIAVLCEEIHFTTKNLKKWSQAKSVSTPLPLLPGRSEIVSEPFGVVGVFAPWNYPVQLLLSPAVGALAAGNCAVLKPADLTSETQKVLIRMINENFDPGLLIALDGGVPECEELLKNKFDFIFFTGSPRVGKIIMKAAAEHLTPVCLELGGKSPCIIDKEANLNVAVKRVVWAKFFNAGQTCVAPDYVYVHHSLRDRFLKMAQERMIEIFGTRPEDCPHFGRIISSNHLQRLVDLMPKDKIVYGGDYNKEKKFLSPTLLSPIRWDDRIMSEEIFGPLLPVLEFQDLETVIKEINDRPKPLALYYFSENSSAQKKIIQETSSGGVCINDCIVHLANPNLPFGGVGNSGMGSYHGEQSFKTLSHSKSVFTNTTLLDPPLRYPPYGTWKERILKKLL